MRYLTLFFLLLICVASEECSPLAGALRNPSGHQVSEDLARAIARGDRGRALELVGPVLEDELGGEYQFGYETRWNAANAIRDLRLVEMTPFLRRVAGMRYSASISEEVSAEDSQRDLLKLFAIKSALSGLTLFGDAEAVTLNRLHVASPVISSTAIRNLKQLKDWEATAQVERILADRKPTREAFLDLTAALDFLVASPVSQPKDCSLLRRLMTTYHSCFNMGSRPPGIAGCEDFVRAARAFEARFECPAEDNPGEKLQNP